MEVSTKGKEGGKSEKEEGRYEEGSNKEKEENILTCTAACVETSAFLGGNNDYKKGTLKTETMNLLQLDVQSSTPQESTN